MIDTRSSRAAVLAKKSLAGSRRKRSPVEARDRSIVGRSGLTDKENIDHDSLHSGSRVIVLCEEGNEWKATIKKSHVKTGQRGYKIHYDGTKRSVEYWVPEERVVASLDEAGRRRPLPPPEKRRQPAAVAETHSSKKRRPPQGHQSAAAAEASCPANASPVHRPRRVSDASDVMEQKASRPEAVDSGRCNAIKVFSHAGCFCDDFDLFDGGLLRSATWDEVLKDL